MHATASTLAEPHSIPLSAPSECKAPASAEERDRVQESAVPAGSAMKGLIMALGIEAATALLFCCIWQAWHFIR